MTIKFRKLGQTEIEISPIGLGVMQFAGGKGALRAAYLGIAQGSMTEIVKTAWDEGILEEGIPARKFRMFFL